MWKVARPKGFEPLTSAFGGQFPRFVPVSLVLHIFVKSPVFSYYLCVDRCPGLLHFVLCC